MHLLFNIPQFFIYLVDSLSVSSRRFDFFVVNLTKFGVPYGCRVRMPVLRLRVYASLQT